jgi:hypothetical protein
MVQENQLPVSNCQLPAKKEPGLAASEEFLSALTTGNWMLAAGATAHWQPTTIHCYDLRHPMWASDRTLYQVREA